MMIPRFLTQRLPAPDTRRLVMVTGARQTGKTTLAQNAFANLRYISLDEIETRLLLRELPTRDWASAVGAAILDEAQKEPTLFEKLKFAYDRGDLDFSVLLGSSQIMMLKRIRETLAGRVFIYELWPLLLAEMTHKDALSPPLFDRLLTETGSADDIFAAEAPVLFGDEAHRRTTWLNYALTWGGMPGLLPLNETERQDWLRSYTNTYLERDLSDLARLDNLLIFRRFQRLAALRSGKLLSYADLARDAGISAGTARNYLHYLTVSYQTFLLRPYFGNHSKRLVKSPKLFWVDVGLWRQQTGIWEGITGELLETFVVGECYKWVKTMRPASKIWFYRSHGGLEVDLLLSTPEGLWGIEIKTSRRASLSQANSLRRLANSLNENWRGGIIVYLGEQLLRLGDNLWAVPVGRLLS